MPTEDMRTIIDHDQFQSESRLDAIESRLKHQEEKLKDLESQIAITSATLKGFLAGYEMRDK